MQPALVKTTTTVVAATALNENCSARRKKANVRVKKKMEQIYMGNRKKVQLEKKSAARCKCSDMGNNKKNHHHHRILHAQSSAKDTRDRARTND